jgi:hypothetical protein
MRTPLSVYSPSERAYPAKLNVIAYEEPYIVRPIRRKWNNPLEEPGSLHHGSVRNYPAGLLPGSENALEVYFGNLHLGTIDCLSLQFIPKPR